MINSCYIRKTVVIENIFKVLLMNFYENTFSLQLKISQLPHSVYSLYIQRTLLFLLFRVFWSVVVAICFAVCFWMLVRTYQKWRNSPVLVTFATEETPIYEIPFPAVTICPEAKFAEAYNHDEMSKMFENGTLSVEKQKEYHYFGTICDNGWNLFPDIATGNGSDFFEVINNGSLPLPIVLCHFNGEDFDCENGFKKVMTDEGLCYTFNMMNGDELFRRNSTIKLLDDSVYDVWDGWTLEEGYLKDSKLEAFPRRALFSGIRNSLELFLMTPNKSIDYTCTQDGLQGYKVSLHIPHRLPRVSQDYFQVPLDQSIVASIQPKMVKTSPEVKDYEPHRRKCYFASEKKLRYFRNYTRLNCQMECLADFTWNACECVQYFLPRNESMVTCGRDLMTCARQAEKQLETAQLLKKLKGTYHKQGRYSKFSDFDNLQASILHNYTDKQINCDCLPLCVDLTYDVELSQNNWDFEQTLKAHLGVSFFDKNEYKFSQLKLYFKSSSLVTLERNELYGPFSFFANFGGLLGLFMGFSVISLLEFVYFLTLRILCNVGIYGRDNWSGKTD